VHSAVAFLSYAVLLPRPDGFGGAGRFSRPGNAFHRLAVRFSLNSNSTDGAVVPAHLPRSVRTNKGQGVRSLYGASGDLLGRYSTSAVRALVAQHPLSSRPKYSVP